MHLAWRNIRLSSRPRDHFFGKWVYAFGIRKSGWFLGCFYPVSRCFWNLEADFGADFGADSGADRAEIGFSLDALKVPKEKPSFEGFCSVFGRGACRFALVWMSGQDANALPVSRYPHFLRRRGAVLLLIVAELRPQEGDGLHLPPVAFCEVPAPVMVLGTLEKGESPALVRQVFQPAGWKPMRAKIGPFVFSYYFFSVDFHLNSSTNSPEFRSGFGFRFNIGF